MDFQKFLENQQRIYSEFRDTSKIEKEGLIPQISENKGGYIIALRHSDNIVTGIEKLNEKISGITSAIKYEDSNIHTTLATYQVEEGFCPIKDTLDNLAKIVGDNISFMKKMEIEYNELLIDQYSGIAAGIPDLAFFENAQRIIDCAQGYGIQLKFPWGAHITVSRFLEKLPHKETLELLEIFRNSEPLGKSTPKYLDVGYFTHTPGSFTINVVERFKITS